MIGRNGREQGRRGGGGGRCRRQGSDNGGGTIRLKGMGGAAAQGQAQQSRCRQDSFHSLHHHRHLLLLN
eukprot:scaffold1513_cov100-Amphora_coffeaeformis.AAC.11